MDKKTKWNKGIKYLGISLLFIVIPGSTFLLPFVFSKKIKNSEKSKDVLGI